MRRIMSVLVFSVFLVHGGFVLKLEADVLMGMAPVGPGDSQQIYYEVQGSGDPVVMIHGLSLDHRMWDAQFSALAVDHQVIRYDMIGHGLSSGATDTVHGWENLRDLLDHLNVDRAHIVGLSMGGPVAVDFALEFPERTRSLTVVDGFMAGHYWDLSSGKFIDRLNDYLDVSVSLGLRPALEQWIADPLFAPAMDLPEVKSQLKEIILEGQAALGTGAAFYDSNLNWYKHPKPNARSRLADIEAPTLIIVGELDLPDFHTAGNVMLQNIPNAQRVIVAGAGHMTPMERPAETSHLLSNFFATVPEPSSIAMLVPLILGIASWHPSRKNHFRRPEEELRK